MRRTSPAPWKAPVTNLPRPIRTSDKVAFTDGRITRTGEILAMESRRFTLLPVTGGPLWLEVMVRSGMAARPRLPELSPRRSAR